MLADLVHLPVVLGAILWHSVFFYLFAAIACAFGAAVLLTSNVVRMAFYLVISLAATAGLFFLAGAEFLGAMQIMIYVGGTLVLLIFGVMLTAQEAFVSMKTRGGEWVLGLLVGGSLLTVMVAVALNIGDWSTARPEAERLEAAVMHQATTQIGSALVGVRVDTDRSASPSIARGMSGYLLAFEAIGIHLLVVLVGAAYLSRTKKFLGGRSRTLANYEPRVRRRHWTISMLLGVHMGICLVLAALSLGAPAFIAGRWPEVLTSPPAWLGPSIAVLFLASALFLAVVWGWQRWGLVALWIVPVVQGILLAQAGVATLWAAIATVVLLIPIAKLTVFVCWGRPNAWSQMD
jgi:NADH-quinone oxidoreductase subunit J